MSVMCKICRTEYFSLLDWLFFFFLGMGAGVVVGALIK